jgi:hypothetical protein
MNNKGQNNNNKLPRPGYADSMDKTPYTPPTTDTIRKPGSPTAVQVLHEPLDESTATIIKLSDPLSLDTSPYTIVTAYFRVKSKHSSDKYDNWMRNIFSLQDCMVIFTQPDMVETVKSLRAHALNKTVIVVQQSMADLPVSKLYQETHNNSFWQDQLIMDKEGKQHKSFELFWIWLSKSWWVLQAIEQNFFHSDFYMYSDIGCFRNSGYNGKTLIQHPEITNNTVLWMAHHKPNPPPVRLWNDKFRDKANFYHSGSQGAGTVLAWRRFHRVFAETMDQFASNGLFIGEDQCILQSACLGTYTENSEHAPVTVTVANNENNNKSSTVAAGVCQYVPFDQVPHDNHYFGLRYVLHHGGDKYQFWDPPHIEYDIGVGR